MRAKASLKPLSLLSFSALLYKRTPTIVIAAREDAKQLCNNGPRARGDAVRKEGGRKRKREMNHDGGRDGWLPWISNRYL